MTNLPEKSLTIILIYLKEHLASPNNVEVIKGHI